MGRKKKVVTTFQYFKADPFLASLGIHAGRECPNDYRQQYAKLEGRLEKLLEEEDQTGYYEYLREITENDFFAFCYFVLDLPVNNPFWLARCYQLQDEGIHMKMDMWARGHGKTLLKSSAYTIWRVCRNRDELIGFFCYNRKLSKAILGVIKSILESNEKLHKAYPHIFYEKPKRQARYWSREEGLFAKQTKEYKEPTFSAWGLVDGMPVGYHFTMMIYDDIVTEHTVGSPLQVQKATDAFKLSDNLGIDENTEKSINGTRYHHKDPYYDIMQNSQWTVRVYPSEVVACDPYRYGHTQMTFKGKIMGIPTFKTRENLDNLLLEQGERMYAAQNLLDPSVSKGARLHEAFLRWRDPEAKTATNKIIIMETARRDTRAKDVTKADYTAMWVIGIDFLKNYHVYDCIRDRLSLSQKWDAMSDLVRRWELSDVYLERHGSNEEVQYYEEHMEKEGLYFSITEINTKTPKPQRIEALATLFVKQRIIFPRTIPYKTVDGEYRDMITDFIEEEYKAYPFFVHDDMMDCLAYIMNPMIAWKIPTQKQEAKSRGIINDPLDMFSTVRQPRIRDWRAL